MPDEQGSFRVGKLYQVDIDDCCVELHFASELTGVSDDETRFTFANGVVIDSWLFPSMVEHAPEPGGELVPAKPQN